MVVWDFFHQQYDCSHQVLAGSFAKKFPNATRLGLGIGEDRDGDMRTRVSMMDLLRLFIDY